MLDFYDKDIEKKLIALEEEEDELLRMEAAEDKLMENDDSENSDGVTFNDLKKSLKEVRGKKAMFKHQHKMKARQNVRPKNAKLSDMIEGFESKGIAVNKESLKSRSKSRRSIADLEKSADALAKKVHDDESGDDEVVQDKVMANAEQQERGRKRRRGKEIDSDDYMDVDEGPTTTKSSGKRSMTPTRRKITADKMVRSKTQERREGSVPKRLAYKLVPEEQIRLAKKINKVFKHKVNVDASDRTIQVKKPKWIFAGKMDNGSHRQR